MITMRKLLARRLGLPALAICVLAAGTHLAIAQQPPKNSVTHEAPKSLPAIAFEDSHGRGRSLADFRGKVVLLNVWATWCAPCRREMPALDRLQAALGGAEFEVVALSIDRSGIEVVRKFYGEVGVRNLGLHIDSGGKAVRDLATVGVPATLLIDREGREIGRLAGPAEWDAPEVVEFLKQVMSRPRADRDLGVEYAAAQRTVLGPGTCNVRRLCGEPAANRTRPPTIGEETS